LINLIEKKYTKRIKKRRSVGENTRNEIKKENNYYFADILVTHCDYILSFFLISREII